ncbi:MAG: class A beta-lactamase [Xanthomonadales bacterium]|jgi:beta-lactamase class A|nr:class A beta-lactamase [Xanthomonadales bacterium]
MLARRDFLFATAAGLTLAALPAHARSDAARADPDARLRALESGAARLGVCFLDTRNGEVRGNRLDERFAFCSTFKLAMVAACLREADHGRLDLDEVLRYGKDDLLEWAPVTGEHVAQGGLPIRELARAAQTLSDGTAANLLVRRLGGPAAVTAKFREMGDTVTRLDRYEPDLGLVLSADLRDTTTPRAMAELVRRITTGELLQPTSRALLLDWMITTQTGAHRLRAGTPEGWRIGNKTGTGRTEGTTNKVNDVAIVFPPEQNPIVIAAYYDSGVYTAQTERAHEDVLAEVARIASDWALR